MTVPAQRSPDRLAPYIKAWGRELGFDAVGIAGVELAEAEAGLLAWLGAGFHGEMGYMARHGAKRARPAELVPGTISVISVRLDYRPGAAREPHAVLDDPWLGYVSRYALGRDYHKAMRNRLQKLADRIAAEAGPFGHRVFCDSAPVMEVALAANAGLGWRGKHTLLLTREGSWFFLGEIYTDLPLPADGRQPEHCGSCERCIDACPTGAIVAPYRLDARRCISYLTIEHPGAIPTELRPLLGNRIYGCDDCQLACPWNGFGRPAASAEFAPREGLDGARLAELFAWTEDEFEAKLAGSPIRRIGHERWLRNVAVAIGNAPHDHALLAMLIARRDHPSALVREHVAWAIARQSGEEGRT